MTWFNRIFGRKAGLREAANVVPEQEGSPSEGDVAVLSADEVVWFGADDAAYAFGEECAKFRDENPYSDRNALNVIINTLMTELWDRGFSQTEIRTAFQDALGDMNRYAAGYEQRP